MNELSKNHEAEVPELNEALAIVNNMIMTTAEAEKYKVDAQERIAKDNNAVKLMALNVRTVADKRDSIIATIMIFIIIAASIALSLMDKLSGELGLVLGGAFTTFGAKFFAKFFRSDK